MNAYLIRYHEHMSARELEHVFIAETTLKAVAQIEQIPGPYIVTQCTLLGAVHSASLGAYLQKFERQQREIERQIDNRLSA